MSDSTNGDGGGGGNGRPVVTAETAKPLELLASKSAPIASVAAPVRTATPIQVAQPTGAPPRPAPPFLNVAIQATANITNTTYDGPIPPPALLAQYGIVDPTLPNRMMTQVELEAGHRRRMEERLVKTNAFLSSLGMAVGVTVVLSGFGLAAWLATIHPAAGVVFGVAEFVTLAGVFINSLKIRVEAEQPPEPPKKSKKKRR